MPDRLDRAMLARGLAESRERAQGLIEAGLVLVDGLAAGRAAQSVEDTADIQVTGVALPFVGRGGLKMEAALRRFRINVAGARCLDVGASTGGFTDCMLQRGAAHVTAIDVGHGQLHPSLAANPAVELREGVNARYLNAADFPAPYDLAAIDVSFISVTLILPSVAPLVRPGGHLVVLIKPEFEAGRKAVGARGIVRDAGARKAATDRVMEFAAGLGLEKRGLQESPRSMAGGNREYIACFRLPKPASEAIATPAAAPASEEGAE